MAYSQDYARMMENSESNFYEIQESFEAFYANKTYEKGKGFKQFKRWEDFMGPRVYPSGNLVLGKQIWKEFESFKRNYNTSEEARSANWTAVGPTTIANGNGGYSPGLGRVNTVAQDPNNANVLYVGVPQGGVWKSTNGGTTWTPKTTELPVSGISDITIDPNNSNIIYVCTGDGDGNDSYGIGVIKSIDGGENWTNTTLIWESGMEHTARRLVISHANSNHLYATTSKGVYKSLDAGVHWILIKDGAYKDLEMHPTNANTIFICNNRIEYSTDGGDNFTIASGINSNTRVEISISESNPSRVYAVTGNSEGGLEGFYQSTDGGQTFTLKSNSPNILSSANDGSGNGGQAWYDLAIVCDPSNSNTVYVGGVNVWKTTNGGNDFDIITHWSLGTNWVEYLHGDIHTLEFFGNNFYAGSDGGIAISTNDGDTWNDLSSGLQNSQFYEIDVMPSNANKLIAGAQDNGSLRIDGTNAVQVRGGDGMNVLFHRSNPNVWFYEWQYGGVHRTTDGGNSADYIKPNGVGDGNWNTPFITSPSNHNTIYIGYENLFKSTNMGDNYTERSVPGTDLIDEIAVYDGNDNFISVSKGSSLLISTDNGVIWTNILPLPNLFITGIVYNPSDSDEMWVTFSGFDEGDKVYHTANGGLNWENISLNLPNIPVNKIIYEPGSDDGIYIGTDMGVFYKNNDLANWISFSDGLPVTIITDLVYHEGTDQVFAGTYGRGIYKTDAYSPSTVIPEASFNSNIRRACTGQDVEFTDMSMNHQSGWTWTFASGSPATSSDQNPIVSWDQPGEYEVSLTVSNSNGPATETRTAFIKVFDTTGNRLPYFEGFEVNQTIETANFDVSTNNNTINWEVKNGIGASGTKSAFLRNSIALPSSTYELTSQSFNVADQESIVLSFKYAFAKKNANSDDRLRVYVSNDCGESWTLRKNINTDNLSTSPDNFNDWTPGTDEWTTINIENIQETYLTENFKFRLTMYSEGGNDLYIDDINLVSTLSLEEGSMEELTVYPNPFQNEIKINGIAGQSYQFQLWSIDGKIVKSGAVASGVIRTEELIPGMYLLKLNDGNLTKEIKMMKH